MSTSGNIPQNGGNALVKPPAQKPLQAPNPPPQQQQAQHELIESVRSWVHFDNLAESLNKQVTNVRNMRNTYEEKILKMLETTGMRNAVLQITGATLQRQTQVKPVDLSWSLLEEQLHEYYKLNRKPDETSQIVEFIKKHRGSKSTEYLKKTSTADTLSKKNPS
jgi:hypothetical protein